MRIEKKITLESGTLELHSEGYLIVSMSEYAKVDLAEAQKREKAFLALCNKPMPFVIRTKSKLIDYTDEAREFMAKNSTMDSIRVAEAFICNNLGVQLFIENYLKKNPEKCPSKIFTDEKDAINWIGQFH